METDVLAVAPWLWLWLAAAAAAAVVVVVAVVLLWWWCKAMEFASELVGSDEKKRFLEYFSFNRG